MKSIAILYSLILLFLGIHNRLLSQDLPISDFTTYSTIQGTPVYGIQTFYLQGSTNIWLLDQSQNDPNAWHWIITKEPSGTIISEAFQQNIEVVFTELGEYTISLTVTNSTGSDTEIKSHYIKIDDIVATNASIFTPNCSPVPDSKIISEIWSPSDILAINTGYQSFWPNAILINDASYTYNCHGYAWHVIEGGENVWVGYSNPGAEEIYWDIEDQSYIETTSGDPNASKISFVPGDHSAVVTSINSDFIESKWAMGPLMNHHKNYCPYSNTSTQFSYYKLNTNKGHGADFVGTPTIIQAGESVSYLNLSSANFNSFEWSFPGGTPSSSTLENPIVTYNSPGIFDATLEATAYSSCANTKTETDYINVSSSILNADYSYYQSTYGPNYIVEFNDLSSGVIESWLWDFGDGQTSPFRNPSHVYGMTGTFQTSLTVSDNLGQSTINKTVEVTTNPNININISAQRWEVAENTYEFIVEVEAPNQSYDHDIDIYFDEGSNQATIENYEYIQYSYIPPVSTTTKEPYTIVTTRNTVGQIVAQQMVSFTPISLYPSSYELNIMLTALQGHILPGSYASFEAEATNQYGPVWWDWYVNTNEGDLVGLCSPSIESDCNFEEGITYENEKYITGSYYFQNTGTYKITVIANDLAGKYAHKEFLIDVIDEIDPCIIVDYFWNNCTEASDFCLNSETSIFDNSSTHTNCLYDGIIETKWFQNSELIEHHIYTDDAGYNIDTHRDGCFQFESTGIHTIRYEAYAGKYSDDGLVYQHANGDPFSSFTKHYNVVDCNENVTITSQSELNNYLGVIQAGSVHFNPSGGNQIIFNSNNSFDIASYNEIVFHPGVTIQQSSDLIALSKNCPDYGNDCDCPTYKDHMFIDSVQKPSEIRVYPNPTKNNFTVTSLGSKDIIQDIEIINTMGEIILRKEKIHSTSIEIDLPNCHSGLYLIKIYSDNNICILPLIKQ